MSLTRRQARQLMRLLGKYQTRIEEEIKSMEPVGEPGSLGYLPGEREILAISKRDWQAAEAWVKQLEAVL